ncbi:MAG: stage 0 sporulation family protein [Bacteroidota bacterium]
MGCSSCSSGGGTPRGCKNNGTCSSGGCNKLDVFDFLGNMSLGEGVSPFDMYEVRFKNSRKGFFRNSNNLSLQVGDVVVVEASPGYDVGVVSVGGELARIQIRKKAPDLKPLESKKILRIANQAEIDKWIQGRTLEKDVMYQARSLAVNLKLEMKISDVEYQADLSKATFYYTAEGRVDFRQLIKDMADKFKIRVEMRQIGSRQEASRLGGIGSCGRELCCSTWLTDFRTVSTSAARYQQLSLNPQKLAGQCGKLKCCLNYELDMYMDAIKEFPKSDVRLKTEKGNAFHIKTDVFKRQMWFAYEGEMGLISLTPDKVKDIIKMNKDGKLPKDLKEFTEYKEKAEKVIEPGYENVVGQDSLNRFENSFKKKKKKKKPFGGNNPNNPNNQQRKPNPNQQPKP